MFNFGVGTYIKIEIGARYFWVLPARTNTNF